MLTWLRERIPVPRHLFDRRTARRDAAAGAVLATIDLLLPAAVLAFVGLVQGAGVSAGFPNPDGTTSPSRDFIGQGAGNIASGLFRGVPVGGSMSATSLVVNAGARNRFSLLVAAPSWPPSSFSSRASSSSSPCRPSPDC